ncbi:hypothetical protein [Bacillus sp. FJAT-27245]|nr:hypothetical protein [Bacillus sp. FJAT-27245]
MENLKEIRYCENCKQETEHLALEDSLEIEYHCAVCGQNTEVYKNYF